MFTKKIKLLFLFFVLLNSNQNLFCQNFILTIDSLNIKFKEERLVTESSEFTVLNRKFRLSNFKINDTLVFYYENLDLAGNNYSYDFFDGFMIKFPQNYLIFKCKFSSDLAKTHQIILLDRDKKIKNVLHFKAGNLIGVSIINYFEEDVIELFCLIYSVNSKYTISKMNIFDLSKDGFAEKLYFDYNHLGANNSYIQTFTKVKLYEKYLETK
jgi:hypothetical protein